MNKREFLKKAGLGFAASGAPANAATQAGKELSETLALSKKSRVSHFNMCGYAAPSVDTVRIAFIGVGNRGYSALKRFIHLGKVEITAVADIAADKLDQAKVFLAGTPHRPEFITGGADAWKRAIERENVDLVYICTPWSLHAPMALHAMNHGKHAAVEIPAALSLQECWDLVEISEHTRKHCVMLENCCYGFFELLTLNMARQNYFGEIVHTEGAYIHDVFESLFDRSRRSDLWKLKEHRRNANVYPTHGLGPVSQILNINRGDQYDYLVSMASDDFMVGKRADELATRDPSYAEFKGHRYGGNMNTTTIRTKKGKTILLQHDETSPRVYSRTHLISGTHGSALQYPLPGKIAKGNAWLSETEIMNLEQQFAPPIVRKIGEVASKIGGHGGMDFLMDWRLIDCLRNGLPMEMDVYDAAAWSCIIPLSEWSVANRSSSIDVPDFTGGAWRNNVPVDISMTTGGNTPVISQ